MDQTTLVSLVAEVLFLRNTAAYRDEENELVRSGKVLNSQVGGSDPRARADELRRLAPGPMLLGADMETGSGWAADGLKVPPFMALGAAGREDLATAWARAVGREGRRIGLDVIWSPVLDINTNPDNPIINVRSFGEDKETVSRLGAATVRGFRDSGIHFAAKHWPGHGDVAVDSHIALPRLDISRERLTEVELYPYRAAAAAGLESVMTAHLLVPSVDPEHCVTVSPRHMAILRGELGLPGPHFTDSLAMEGLRTTVDSAEAAWMALAAGHDLILVDYKRSPLESYAAVLAACRDGRVPESRLGEAAAKVRALKQRLANLPPLPPAATIRADLEAMAKQVAEASTTARNWTGSTPDFGAKPLLLICDDLKRRGLEIADEQTAGGLAGRHPAVAALRQWADFTPVILPEDPAKADDDALAAQLDQATAILGVTFARISCYKGDGTRLPASQAALWRRLHQSGKLRAMLLFESPYALEDLPNLPTVVGYGSDPASLQAATAALFGALPCRGRLPVTVRR